MIKVLKSLVVGPLGPCAAGSTTPTAARRSMKSPSAPQNTAMIPNGWWFHPTPPPFHPAIRGGATVMDNVFGDDEYDSDRARLLDEEISG